MVDTACKRILDLAHLVEGSALGKFDRDVVVCALYDLAENIAGKCAGDIEKLGPTATWEQVQEVLFKALAVRVTIMRMAHDAAEAHVDQGVAEGRLERMPDGRTIKVKQPH